MNKGLFDLSILESVDDNELFDLKINEEYTSTEETPTFTEGQEISARDYNQALTNTTKVIQEAMEVLNALQTCTIVEQTEADIEAEKDLYVEECMMYAAFDVYRDSPMFEGTDDRKAVIEVVKALHKKFGRKSNDRFNLFPFLRFAEVSSDAPLQNGFGRFLKGYLDINSARPLVELIYKAIIHAFRDDKTLAGNMYQIVGILTGKGHKESDIIAHYNDKAGDALGEFSLELVKIKFGWWTNTFFIDTDRLMKNGLLYLLVVRDGNKMKDIKLNIEKPDGFDAQAIKAGVKES